MKTQSSRIAASNGEMRFLANGANALTAAPQFWRVHASPRHHAGFRHPSIDVAATQARNGMYVRPGTSARSALSKGPEQECWAIAERWVHSIAWASVGVTILIDIAVTFGPKLGWT
jgi:hypothetical protein